MNLYRLDPPAWNDGLGRQLSAVVKRGKLRAEETRRPIRVVKIDGRTLRVSHVRTIAPNGKVTLA